MNDQTTPGRAARLTVACVKFTREKEQAQTAARSGRDPAVSIANSPLALTCSPATTLLSTTSRSMSLHLGVNRYLVQRARACFVNVLNLNCAPLQASRCSVFLPGVLRYMVTSPIVASPTCKPAKFHWFMSFHNFALHLSGWLMMSKIIQTPETLQRWGPHRKVIVFIFLFDNCLVSSCFGKLHVTIHCIPGARSPPVTWPVCPGLPSWFKLPWPPSMCLRAAEEFYYFLYFCSPEIRVGSCRRSLTVGWIAAGCVSGLIAQALVKFQQKKKEKKSCYNFFLSWVW